MEWSNNRAEKQGFRTCTGRLSQKNPHVAREPSAPSSDSSRGKTLTTFSTMKNFSGEPLAIKRQMVFSITRNRSRKSIKIKLLNIYVSKLDRILNSFVEISSADFSADLWVSIR